MYEIPRSLQSWINAHYKVKGRKQGNSTEFANINEVTKQAVTIWKRKGYIVYKNVLYSPMRQVKKRNEK